MNEYRIIEQNGLFYTEYLKYGFFKNKWVSFNTYRGCDEPYGFSSLINAENSLLIKIKENNIWHQIK